MPRHLPRLLLTLLLLSFSYAVPAVSAQETGTRELLERVKELKSVVRIEANEIERREREKLTIARGDVRIQMEGRSLYADEVELDQVQEIVRARGKVQLIEGARRLEGERFDYHYRTNTGVMYQGKGSTPSCHCISRRGDPQGGGAQVSADRGKFHHLPHLPARAWRGGLGSPGVRGVPRAGRVSRGEMGVVLGSRPAVTRRPLSHLSSWAAADRPSDPQIGYSNLSGFTYKQPFSGPLMNPKTSPLLASTGASVALKAMPITGISLDRRRGAS